MTLNALVDSGVPLPPPDIQRTTFSVDGLARFTCNTWEEILAAQAGGQFDIVIVGAGMYGAYTAAKLFELGRRMARAEDSPRVLVLESGPFLIAEHIQNLTRRSTDLGSTVAEDLVDPGQTNEPSFVRHFRCVGGKSLFWGGWAPRYLPEDMHRLDADGDRLWPEEVEDYLFTTGFRGGYEYCEREIGAVPEQDFINGPLYDSLKALAEAVVAGGAVPSLTAVLAPPIAVQGESPGSGLFSFDKYSSVPLLLDSVREDAELAASNSERRLFLVPYANVLKLDTADARVRQVVVALSDPAAPRDRRRARVVRLNLKSSAQVVLAGNTINSTRLALNSFPRPAPLNRNGELMGRNLMVHVRSNFVWRVKRSALDLPAPDPANMKTAALHITGSAPTPGSGAGQFHFQLYAAPNMDVPMFPGASRDPERFLYAMVPNIEDLESMVEAQSGLGNDRVAISIRTVGETFGDRSRPIASGPNASWMNVNPFGGWGDDVYVESGNELRIPKAYVHLVKTADDAAVLAAQDAAAFAFIDAMVTEAGGGGPAPAGPQPASAVEVIAQVPLNAIPDGSYRMENTAHGRFFVGRFGQDYRVLDGTCTHEGCFVNWMAATGVFGCPCHTAYFAADGANISGPPPSPLASADFRLQGGNLEILVEQGATPAIEYVGGGRDGIGTTYHEAGTLWLGTDFAKSVTDVNGRFHHVTNAYCVDQSIFPTAGSANPVLTGIALSRKIARSIVERFESAAYAAAEPGYVPLYHGDLAADGWTAFPGGSANFFDVAEAQHPVLGAGVDGTTPATGVLWYSNRAFRDFVLRLDWKAYDIAANSGVFLRMPQPAALDDAFYGSTIEVQIDERGHDHRNGIYGSPLHKTGAVYDAFPARSWAAKVVPPRGSGRATFWNALEITLQGGRIEVRLNGQLVSAGEFANLLPFAAPAAGNRKRSEGYIGLQCHTEVVQFRSIRIREL
jgi:choline dehydrogenase-like flavoprotein/Rieske Fe-S protein